MFTLLIAINAHSQTAVSSEFTYQGNLIINSVPAQGLFDFDVYLFDAAENGNQTGQVMIDDVDVNDGFFSVELDFGDIPFSGNVMWLEIHVSEDDPNPNFIPLLPRQKITNTPYAIQAQYVANDAVGTSQIQSLSITESKISNLAVTTNKLNNQAVTSAKLAPNSVNNSHIDDGTVESNDLANASVTQNKLSNQSVGINQIISSEVQQRVIGNCSPGQFVTSINQNGSLNCADVVDQSAQSVCRSSTGTQGIVINGVCVLDYNNSSSTQWSAAANQCAAIGGDLCSVSQYYALSNDRDVDNQLFYSGRAVWANDFSDNDGSSKSAFINSSDNPASTQNYGYACCSNVVPEPRASLLTDVNGVNVAFIHDKEDTTWSAAARICTDMNTDLCSKAQYVALNDNNQFPVAFRKATNEMSDNDAGSFDSVVGTNTDDNSSFTNRFSFACCAQSNKHVDLSCPGTTVNGLCVGTIHDTEDASFFDAARACQNEGAKLCTKSQMQVLRDANMFSNACWTADGADNDGGNVGGLLSSQPDNPNPNTDDFGYACCYQ